MIFSRIASMVGKLKSTARSSARSHTLVTKAQSFRMLVSHCNRDHGQAKWERRAKLQIWWRKRTEQWRQPRALQTTMSSAIQYRGTATRCERHAESKLVLSPRSAARVACVYDQRASQVKSCRCTCLPDPPSCLLETRNSIGNTRRRSIRTMRRGAFHSPFERLCRGSSKADRLRAGLHE